MSTPSQDHPLDDVAAYAAGALEPDERRTVEAHLATCTLCQAELAAHRDALARLVPDEEPPAGLWDRIVASLPEEGGTTPTGATPPAPGQVRGRIEIRPRALRTPDSPEGPATPPGPPPPPPSPPSPAAGGGEGIAPPGPPAPVDSDRSARPRHLAGRPRRPRAARALAPAAAAVLLVVAAVATTLALTGDDGDDEGGDTPDVAGLADRAAAQATGVAPLAADDGAPRARLVTSDEGSFVLFDDLPTLPAGRAYQLWSLDAATPVSLGVLGDGSAPAVAVAVPPGVGQVAISDAPAGGEAAPSGPIVATGEVAPA